MSQLRPWGKKGDKSADAVPVDGGLVIGLFEGDKPCCYIVTDGRAMHKYAAVTSYYDVKPGEKMRWTGMYISLTYVWRGTMSLRGERACREMTGENFDALCELLESNEAAAKQARKNARIMHDKRHDIAAVQCVLEIARPERALPNGFDAWALARMRETRKRVLRAYIVRVGKVQGGKEHLCSLRYTVRRSGEHILATLERIGIVGDDFCMQLSQECNLCGWTHPSGWAADRSSAKMSAGYIYPSREVRGEFAGTAWAHVPIWLQCRQGAAAIDPHAYALQYRNHGGLIERMTRAGLYRMAETWRWSLDTGTGLRADLDVTRSELRILRAMDADADDYGALRKIKSLGETQIDAEMIGIARDTHICTIEQDQLLPYKGQIRKLITYLAEQEQKNRISAYQTMTWIIDGHRMERQLHVPTIEWPRDVRAWHNTLTNMQKAEDAAKYNDAIAQRASSLAHLADTRDGIVIRPMASGTELFEEGVALEHCVASYARRYAEGESLIFCARLACAPEIPLVTFEVRGGKVEQVRGHNNRIHTEDERRAKAAVDAWERDVLAQLAKKKQAAD